MAGESGMRLVQGALLWAYRGVRRSGVLGTAPGRAAFEGAYWAYKSFIEARDLETLRPYVKPGSTVVDVGANIGFFTVRFAQWTGPAGRVVAIEPEVANFTSLRERLERRRLSSRVTLVKAAAVESPGSVFLQLNPDNPADHRVAESGASVEAVSVDSLLAAEPAREVSFVKVDVQGGELRVIRGARVTLARWRPALFLEFHEPSLALAGTTPAELLAEIKALGYAAHVRDRSGWQPIADDALFEGTRARGYLDVLFLSDDKPAGI